MREQVCLCASVERKVSTRALAFFRNALGSILLRHFGSIRNVKDEALKLAIKLVLFIEVYSMKMLLYIKH